MLQTQESVATIMAMRSQHKQLPEPGIKDVIVKLLIGRYYYIDILSQ